VTDTELELPQGWVDTTVEQCVNILDGKRIPINSKERAKRIGKIPYYGATKQTGWINDFIFNEELVLIGEDGAPFLDFAKDTAYIISGKSWVNNHAHVVRAIDELTSNQFLCHYLNIFDYHEFITGTTRMKLNQSALKKIPILLPPLNEQKRIVTKIEELFSKIDSTKQSLEQTKLQLEQYRVSLLKSAFEGKLTKKWREENKDNVGNVKKFLEKFTVNNFTSSILKPSKSTIPEIWDFALSNHVFDFITSGSRGWAKFYSETGSIFIRITNLNYNSIELDFQKIKRVNPPSNSEGIRTKVKPNDILISITGDVGMIALVPEDMPNSYVNQHICLARPYDEINAKYIALYLISDNAKKQFTTLKKGAVKSGLGLGDIRSVWIPFPPLEEQKEIITRIEQCFSLIENTTQMVNSILQNLQTMKMSILKQAFEGKLVPQDPNDEPASALLERIKN